MRPAEINKKVIIMINGKMPVKDRPSVHASLWKKKLERYYRALNLDTTKEKRQGFQDPSHK